MQNDHHDDAVVKSLQKRQATAAPVKSPLSAYTRLALFYSLIIHCISFVYSSLPRPLSKITVARDRYLTKDFNNGLGSELWTIEIQWTI